MNSHKYRHFSQLELSYSANCMGLALHRGFKSYWWFCSHARGYSHDNTHNFFASQNTVVRKKKKMSKGVTNTTGIYKKKKKKRKTKTSFWWKNSRQSLQPQATCRKPGLSTSLVDLCGGLPATQKQQMFKNIPYFLHNCMHSSFCIDSMLKRPKSMQPFAPLFLSFKMSNSHFPPGGRRGLWPVIPISQHARDTTGLGEGIHAKLIPYTYSS